MQANAVGAGALSIGLMEGKIMNDKVFSEKGSGPVMHHGSVLAAALAGTSVISAKADVQTRKKMLRFAGATWAASTAVTLYNVNRGSQKRDASLVLAAGTATMAALNLAAGFARSI